MNKRHNIYIGIVCVMMGLASCSQESERSTEKVNAGHLPMNFVMSYPGEKTRATDTHFDKNDVTGLFVTSYDKPLQIGGNVANDEPLTFDGDRWNAATGLYWDEGTYNVYAYYPYTKSVSSIEDQPFSVSLDQSTKKTPTELGGYEASDLLYASAKNIAASADPVHLTFKHIMSKLTIRLIKGEDFTGEMPANATVYVHNTVPEATVDLQAGVVTRSVKGVRQTRCRPP